MRKAVCLILGLLMASFVFAQEETTKKVKDPEAMEILQKVDAAVKAVDVVRYKAVSTPTGIATNSVGPAEGTALLDGWTGGIPERFLSHVKTTMPNSEEPLDLTAGGDGETYFIINHGTKKAYEDMDPNVMGSGGNAFRAVYMVEFVHDTPYDDELNADEVELQGIEQVGEEECYKIRVVYQGGQGVSTWYFSKKDFLPRRRVRHISTPEGDGTFDIVISGLETNPPVDGSLYKLVLPEGYEKIDDFHP